MIRGSFGPCGAAKLPEPIGNIWVIPTNVGEWHILTDDGYYLTRLFQGDPMKIEWPEKAVPGACMDNCPPRHGRRRLRRLHLPAPRTASSTSRPARPASGTSRSSGSTPSRRSSGDRLTITAGDVEAGREAPRRSSSRPPSARKRTTVKKKTPRSPATSTRTSTAPMIQFKKQDDAAVRAAAAWDDQNLYLAWDVRDKTPVGQHGRPCPSRCTSAATRWTSSSAPTRRPTRTAARPSSATCGFPSATSRASPPPCSTARSRRRRSRRRSAPAWSRIPHGLRRRRGRARRSRSTCGDDGYVVEAAIPLAALGFKPADGPGAARRLRRHARRPGGQRTRLRTYWSNQHTGIVDDAVFELQMEPKNWGELEFRN